MRTIFADACYWIALIYPHDQLHQKAKEISRQIGGCRFVTSEMVLTEVLNWFGGEGSVIRKSAGETAKAILANPNVEVIRQTGSQFVNALDLYGKMGDKEWGLTDCASIQIMRERGINEALTNDRHFQQAGFSVLLRDR